MLLRKLIILHLLLLICELGFSQARTWQAVKTTIPPKIDGILDDSVWKDAPAATDFVQNFPYFGKPASQITRVKAAYDNDAIYFGAYLYDDPSLIRRQITARDVELAKDLDFFSVFLDTYHDHQNGYQFLVTTSNVQTDAKLSPTAAHEYGDYGDKSWDAVWDSKVSMVEDGWVVEMKIPFISLRFSRKPVQDWGIQLLRSVRRNNEISFWNPVNPNINGFVNQFGILRSLISISPPLRLSFSPYVSTGVRSTPTGDGYIKEWLGSGGLDVKYGLNESYTLDATLVPDFGQVISDNVINNLTPYEVQFAEYRPFFTEAIEIFNKSGLFYSRRVGAIPAGYDSVKALADGNADLEIVKNPGRTQLYNAVKFSGRTSSRLGIGFFNALTAPMHSTVRNKSTGERQKIQTEPLANYNILVLDQPLKGRSYITVTNTNVMRQGGARDANVSGVDFSLYDTRNLFNIKGYGHFSQVFSVRDYRGYEAQLRLAKVSGKVQYYVQHLVESKNYDPNDLGYLATPNLQEYTGSISYKQLTPTRHFLSYQYNLSADFRRLFSPNRFYSFLVQGGGTWYLRNFWEVSLTAFYLPDQHDYFVLGPPFDQYARRPQIGQLSLVGSTDIRKRLLFNYDFLAGEFFKNPEKKYYRLGGGLRYRVSNRLSLDISHSFETETDYIINAGRDALGRARIAFVDFRDATSILSGMYNFTPRINLTLRLRHYWSHVDYDRIAYLDQKGYPIYPLNSLLENNVNIFNADAFLTWDFRYGSRLILGYKNWLGQDEQVDSSRYNRYLSNLGKTFDLNHGNEFTIRFIYFLDHNQVRPNRTTN